MLKTSLITGLATMLLGFFGISWGSVDRKIDREFPEVRFISSAELVQQQRAAAPPVIIDVRERDEFAVSHLQDSLNLETSQSIAEQFPDKDTSIVVYCSVGYRSAAVADELATLGYTNIRNLHHSIFAWADQGLPMVNAGGRTEKVHPFNRAWGRLVNRELHDYDAP